MPYILQENRSALDNLALPDEYVISMLEPGELNYVLTCVVNVWLDCPNYDRYNAALGVLEAVKQELYRRKIAPYEDEKCEANGDVY